MKKAVLIGLLLSVCALVGCGGGGSTPTPPVVTLVSIQVAPATPSIVAGTTQQFTATGSYSDGSTKVISGANWLSSSGTVATINLSGLAAGVGAGTTTISAASGGITGTTILTVTNPLQSITVSPATATVDPNAQQQFTATGNYTFGSPQDITSSVTWSASTGASITAGGLATASTPNATVTIMATLGSISGTAILTVTNPLKSIAITPAAPSIAVSFTQQFTAIGTYADNSTQVLTSSVTWASSKTNFATISNSPGTQGVATGVSPGATVITATDTVSGKIGTATLTVTNATLVSIAVTPQSPIITLGSQQQFKATGTFTDNSTADITNLVNWTTSDPTTITIVGSGLATGVGVTNSPVTITATLSPGTPGSTTATVIPPTLTSIAITPDKTTADRTLAQGTSRHYVATGTETNGSTVNITFDPLATWTSSDPTIATVGQHTGFVTAKAVPSPHNPVTITVAYSGSSVTGTLLLDVTNAIPTSVTVTPVTATVPVGGIQVFSATATFNDSSTQDVSNDASWVSSDTTVATVTPSTGRTTAIKPGSATITATFGGQSATAQLNVSTATLQSIAVTPAQTLLAPASTLLYQAFGTYSDNTTQNLTLLATWSSSDVGVVTITPNSGIATGFNRGTATITASYQQPGQPSAITSNLANVVVSAFPLASITISPATASVPFGVSVPFVATGKFSDGSTQLLTTNVLWSTGQPSVATISNVLPSQGRATGIAPGQTPITAVFASIAGNATLNVTNATIQSITIAPTNSHAPVGSLVNFTATGRFSDSSTADLTSQVTWSSSNVKVAIIQSNGQAITAGTGVTSISATFTQDGTTVQDMTNLTVP